MLTCTAGILYTLSFAIPFNPGKLECYWAAAIWLQRRMKIKKKSQSQKEKSTEASKTMCAGILILFFHIYCHLVMDDEVRKERMS